MKIILNQAERKLAEYLARCRYENARSKNKPDMKMGNQSNWETDMEGIGGEIAAARYFNVYPDTETDLDELPVFDLVINQKKVDVKTTKYTNGQLLATLKKESRPCDIYVLVTGVMPTYNIVGWAYQQELFQQENISDLGHGNGFALPQNRLRTFLNRENVPWVMDYESWELGH